MDPSKPPRTGADEHQVLTWQMKAEEAFRKRHLEEALQCVEQGMRLDPGATIFTELRGAIIEAQTRMGLYREALKRAEAALRAGDLEAAKQSVEDAQGILPDDPGARTLAGQIIARLEQKLREQRSVEKQRDFARSLNAAEKGMADARMLLAMGQAPEALQALENMESDVSELPPQLIEQFRSLKREAREKKLELERGVPSPWRGDHDGQPAEIPAQTQMQATRMMEPDVRPSVEEDTGRYGDPAGETAQFAAHDTLYPRGYEAGASEEIAPELQEFLEPESSIWLRPRVWVGIILVVIVGVMVWVFARPAVEKTVSPTAPVAASYTYAEINAEPWATVMAVSPASGDAGSVVGQTTPLRVKLPPGEYSVTLQGPNREVKNVGVVVPATGGVSCFAVFQKPDLGRVVGQ